MCFCELGRRSRVDRTFINVVGEEPIALAISWEQIDQPMPTSLEALEAANSMPLSPEAETLFAVGKHGHNIDRSRISDVARHDLIHSGFANFVQLHSERVKAAEAEVFFLIEATDIDSKCYKRLVGSITGTADAPVVFDVTPYSFVTPADATSASLPCEVQLEFTHNRVAEAFLDVIHLQGMCLALVVRLGAALPQTTNLDYYYLPPWAVYVALIFLCKSFWRRANTQSSHSLGLLPRRTACITRFTV